MFGFGKKKTQLEKDIEKSITEFDAMCKLPLEEMWKIDDENNLLVALSMYESEKCNYGDDLNILAPCERVFYLCQVFEQEINNGGFSQFYYNSSGDHCNETPAALDEIGALYTSKLIKKANSLFGSPLPRDRDAREDLLDELLTDKIEEKLNELDSKFYEYNDDLTKLNYEYVVAHKKDFS